MKDTFTSADLHDAIASAKQEFAIEMERAKQDFTINIDRAKQEFASKMEKIVSKMEKIVSRTKAAAELAEANLNRLLTENWMRERERLTSSTAARCGGTRLL